MGLLDKLSAQSVEHNESSTEKPDIIKSQKKSNSVGLLKKSMILSNNPKLDFFEFVYKYNISTCSLFQKINDNYVITNSIGFDGVSICSSVSSTDFWNGIITQNNKIYNFNKKDNSILPFYQFFSFEQKDKIENISIYKISDELILLFCNNNKILDNEIGFISQLNSIYIDNLQNEINYDIPSDCKVYLYDLIFSKAIEEFITSQNKIEYKDVLSKSLAQAIFYRLQQNFPSPSSIFMDKNFNFKLAFCNPENIPFDILKKHIILNNQTMLKETASYIDLEYNGIIDSFSKMKDFLQAE